jgi:hypothetical protein
MAAAATTIMPGQATMLTLTTPTADYHNVFINGLRPTVIQSGVPTVWALTVTPTITTTYQAAATNTGGVPYVMPSVTVTVRP